MELTKLKKIATSSFKLTFRPRNWLWLGGIPGVATLLALLMQAWQWEWLKAVIVFVGGLLLIGVLLFFRYFIPQIVLDRHIIFVDSNWGETVKDLAVAYAVIHELERKATSITYKDIALALGGFCDMVKKIFDRQTGSDCCVSIKVPVSNYSDSGDWQSIQVKNVARDQDHISERDTNEYKAANHDIIGNTAYSRIVSLVIKESSKPHVYLNNDVDPEKDPNYATTSPTSGKRLAVPFKSELVVPILPSRYKKLNEVSFGGFLCVDSSNRFAFDPNRYDIPMTQGLADGLYALMLKLIELQNITKPEKE